MMGWQWHQLVHKQIICTSLQTDNHAINLTTQFYRPDALMSLNQQRYSTEGSNVLSLIANGTVTGAALPKHRV